MPLAVTTLLWGCRGRGRRPFSPEVLFPSSVSLGTKYLLSVLVKLRSII